MNTNNGDGLCGEGERRSDWAVGGFVDNYNTETCLETKRKADQRIKGERES